MASTFEVLEEVVMERKLLSDGVGRPILARAGPETELAWCPPGCLFGKAGGGAENAGVWAGRGQQQLGAAVPDAWGADAT